VRGKRAPLIAAAVVIALAILAIVLLVLPKMHEISDAQGKLSTAEAEQQTLKTQLQALEQAKAQEAHNRKIIANVQRQLPPTADEPGMLLLLSNAAERAGIKLWVFSPSTPVSGTPSSSTSGGSTAVPAGLTEIPVSFTVKGTYFALTEFLYNVETLPRVAKVQSISIGPGGATSGSGSSSGTTTSNVLQMTGSLNFYTTAPSAGPGAQPAGSSSSPSPSPTG
jgi:Tfp pilus assembly protein PilO